MLVGRKVWILLDHEEHKEECEIVKEIRGGSLKLKRKGLTTFEFDSIGRIPDFKFGQQVFGYLRGSVKGVQQIHSGYIKLIPQDANSGEQEDSR